MTAKAAAAGLVRVNGARLWTRLMEMARIGATAEGGCNRQALTDTDREGRDLFVRWCTDAGCEVRVDEAGNIFARRPGMQAGLPPVIAGSHLDTQPTGGKFDGVYGVLAALEVIDTLNDAGVQTAAAVEAVVWTNEEGARFAPAMLGSGVWAGVFDREYAYARADAGGATFGGELQRIGYRGSEPCAARPLKAAFEAHIEQGPVLEEAGMQIGAVTGIQGVRWYDIGIRGRSSHAGTTPMDVRRDPVAGIAAIHPRLLGLAAAIGPAARLTMGSIRTEPGAYNTVADRVAATVDLRHPQQETLEQAEAQLRAIVDEECRARGLTSDVQRVFSAPPVAFDPACVAAVETAAQKLGYSCRRMISGAGHDSMYIARVAPTAMVFVPCAEGLSHNPGESARPEDLESGCNVLLHAILETAGVG